MSGFVFDEEQLEKVNEFTRRKFELEEVYAFPVVLCDNEIDRDNQRFSVKSLETLKELFIGKTGIFDHNPKGENQTARIYAAEVVSNPDRITAAGEPYTKLVGYAYMVRTEKNSSLIKEIDGGIKREVSVCCQAKSEICSVCGADLRINACSHIKGKVYNGSICHGILEDITDAYEWSFVAVPAQVGAGVTKNAFYGSEKNKQYEQDKQDLQLARDEIIREIISKGFALSPSLEIDIIKSITKGLSIPELIRLKNRLTVYGRVDEKAARPPKDDREINCFKIN